jgi:cellulose synthase/poly-beta-1,6-N-acetylglucosamine synthase-like glycosyltransferase
MTILFYIFAALLIYFSFRSFRGGIDYLNYFKAKLAKPKSEYTPFVTVIVPCKGIDDGLEANLASLFEQDYPEYEVIVVVDDESDAAVDVVTQLISLKAEKPQSDEPNEQPGTASHPTGSTPLFASSRLCGKIPIQIFIASRTLDSSQKVENLREAVLHADPRSEVFVFVDSDARPSTVWLSSLIAPLQNETIGAATGYRWFIPRKPSFSTELRSAWNASIASALGPNMKSNFCWGGSTAITRATFDRLDVREAWRGTLSDDFTITRLIKAAGLSIHFVPLALTRSTDPCSFRELLEFTTRQIKITRVYSPHLWLMSFFGSALFTCVMLSGFLIVALAEQNTPIVWASVATLALVSVFSIGKAWLRLAAVSLVIPEARKQLLPQLTFWILTPPLFLYNCVRALISRTLTWRGIRYKLVSEKQTRRIG